MPDEQKPQEDTSVSTDLNPDDNQVIDDTTPAEGEASSDASSDNPDTADAEPSESIAVEQPENTPEVITPAAAPIKKSKKKLLIILLVLVVVLAGAAAAFMLLNKQSDSVSNNETSGEQTAPTPKMGIAVLLIDGKAEISQDNSSWSELSKDSELKEGDYVRTLDASKVILTFDDGSAIRLASGSVVNLEKLDPSDILVRSVAGEVYSRVVASDSRSYTVSVGDSLYRAKGTAFRTIDQESKKGVEVFHSSVEIDGKDNVPEGSSWLKKDADASKVDKLLALDLEALKNDEFIKWNLDQDKKEKDYADKLGILGNLDKPVDNTPPPVTPSKPVGIVLSGSGEGYNANFSWTVNGVNTSQGFKLVKSKQSTTPTYPDDHASYIEAGKTSYSLKVGDGVTYHYRICAYRGDSCDSYSNTVTVTTAVKPKPVVEAGAVTLSLAGNKINWTFAGTAPYGFKVVISQTTGPVYPDHSKIYTENTSVKLPSDLPAGTHYVRVCKYTDGGCQDYSNEITYIKE